MMATNVTKTIIQFRRAHTSEWQQNKTTIPRSGEPCFDIDLKTLKIGDGVTTYENLPTMGGIDVSVDGKSIVVKDNIFKLAGFDAAEIGAQPRKNIHGHIEWVMPSSETVDGVQTIIAGIKSDITTLQNIIIPPDGETTPILERVETLEKQMNGTGDDSINRRIDDSINEFATKISDDNVVNSYKELIDYVAEHGSDAADMAASIGELHRLVGDTAVGDAIDMALTTNVSDIGKSGNIADAIQIDGDILIFDCGDSKVVAI